MADLEHNKRVVRRFRDEVSDGGDIDLLDELCTPHVINHAARPGLQNGLEAFKALMRGIHQSQGERRWTEQRYVAENDLVVVYGIREGYWRAPSFRGRSRRNSLICFGYTMASSPNTGRSGTTSG